MNSIVEHNKDEHILIKNGKNITETNEFLRDLSNLMENEEFKIFL